MQGINRSVSSFFPSSMASPSLHSYLLICDSMHEDLTGGKPWLTSALMMGQRCRSMSVKMSVARGLGRRWCNEEGLGQYVGELLLRTDCAVRPPDQVQLYLGTAHVEVYEWNEWDYYY